MTRRMRAGGARPCAPQVNHVPPMIPMQGRGIVNHRPRAELSAAAGDEGA